MHALARTQAKILIVIMCPGSTEALQLCSTHADLIACSRNRNAQDELKQVECIEEQTDFLPAEVMPTSCDSTRCTLIQTDGTRVGVPLFHNLAPRVAPGRAVWNGLALALQVSSDFHVFVVHVLDSAPLVAHCFMA